MHILHNHNLDVLYAGAIKATIDHGETSSPRGQKTIELISPLLVLEPQDELPIIRNAGRKLNYAFQIVEALQYLDRCMDVERLCWYNKQFREYLNPDTNEFDGAYGPRLEKQMEYCMELLKRDPDSRQAVMTIFSDSKDHHVSRDIPCTLSLHFLIRNGKLDCVVNMRSNDMLWGTPYDIMGFTLLQHALASWIGIKPGRYFHHPASLHIYDSTREKIDATLASTELNDVKYGAFDLDYDSTQLQLFRFWVEEERSRNGQDIDTSDMSPLFTNLINIVHKHNQKKHETPHD